jgi:hypothetical protein
MMEIDLLQDKIMDIRSKSGLPQINVTMNTAGRWADQAKVWLAATRDRAGKNNL